MKASAVAALSIFATVSLVATLWPHRFRAIYRVPGTDKAGHFLVMGLLAFILVSSLTGTRWREYRLGASACLGLTLLLVSLEEASQLFIPSRTFSWLDLAYSWAGVLVLGGLAAALVRRRRAKAAASRTG
jgi:VanZ family protein